MISSPTLYATQARATAVYSSSHANLPYPALGLAGESAEVLEKVRANTCAALLSPELGDVLWYTAAMRAEARIPTPATWPEPDGRDRRRCAEDLILDAGTICELVKKTMRDHDGQLTDQRRQDLSGLLERMTASLATLARHCDVTIETIATQNLDKLDARRKAGTLHGEGDHR